MFEVGKYVMFEKLLGVMFGEVVVLDVLVCECGFMLFVIWYLCCVSVVEFVCVWFVYCVICVV